MKQSGNNARPVIDLIRKISNPMALDSFWIVIGEVISVDEYERTCVVQPLNDKSEAEIPNVSLSAEANDGQILIPEVGSAVIVGRTEKFQPFIILTSDLAKYILYADDIQFNGNEFGGLVKVNELTTKLNQLITEISANFTAIANIYPYTIVPLTPLVPTDYQNTKVKHGND